MANPPTSRTKGNMNQNEVNDLFFRIIRTESRIDTIDNLWGVVTNDSLTAKHRTEAAQRLAAMLNKDDSYLPPGFDRDVFEDATVGAFHPCDSIMEYVLHSDHLPFSLSRNAEEGRAAREALKED